MPLPVQSCPIAHILRRTFAGTMVMSAVAMPLVVAKPAAADIAPCTLAAATTISVHLFVSDLEASARWYRANVGLVEGERRVDSNTGITTLQMGRPEVGVTLVQARSSNPHRTLDPQMVCFVVDSPLAPLPGSKPLYLTDPDGAAVELAPRSSISNAQN